jgi:hypothetical protein
MSVKAPAMPVLLAVLALGGLGCEASEYTCVSPHQSPVVPFRWLELEQPFRRVDVYAPSAHAVNTEWTLVFEHREPCTEWEDREHTVGPDDLGAVEIAVSPAALAEVGERSPGEWGESLQVRIRTLAEGDGSIVVRGRFGGELVEQRHLFHVRAIDEIEVPHGRYVEGAVLSGLPLSTDARVVLFPSYPVEGPWRRADGFLELATMPLQEEQPPLTTVRLLKPGSGNVKRLERSAEVVWTTYESAIEVVPLQALAPLPRQPTWSAGITCAPREIVGFGRITVLDGAGMELRGGAALVRSTAPWIVRPLPRDRDFRLLCLAPGTANIELVGEGAPPPFTVTVRAESP